MKKFLIYLFVFLILLAPALSFANVGDDGLVNCQTSAHPDACDFKAFMKLINDVIEFIFFYLAVPFAAVMFAYAGFLLITSGTGEGKTKAKGIFSDVVFGLVLAGTAWLVVKTLLSIVQYGDIGTYFSI